MSFNKGAMFGLDARIALAIFGALSVISGAALYSAIQHSKRIALLTDLEEVSKAVQSYLLDTGENIPVLGTTGQDPHLGDLAELVTSSNTSWKGPYVSYAVDGALTSAIAFNKQYNTTISYHYVTAKNNTWGDTTGWTAGYCTLHTSNPCYGWVHMPSTLLSEASKLDEIVDESDGAQNGKFRWQVFGTAPYNAALFYQSTPKL